MDASDSVPVTVRQYGYSDGRRRKRRDGKKSRYSEDLYGLRREFAEECFAGERFQFFRHGYFVADSKLHTKEAPVFNEIVGLKSSWKK